MTDLNAKTIGRKKLLKIGVWFSLLNAVILLLLSIFYTSLMPVELIAANKVYLFLLIVSHFVFLSFIPFFLVYAPVAALTKSKRASMLAIAIVNTLLLVILLIDVYTFSLYRFHLNESVLEQLLGPDASQVFELAFTIYIMTVVIFALLVLGEIALYRLACRVESKVRVRWLYAICGLIVVCGLTAQTVHAYGEVTGNRKITGMDKYFPLFISFNSNKLDLKNKTYNYPKNSMKTDSSGKNMVIIVLDSWVHQALDSTISPNLYRFAQRSSLFTNHLSGSNGTRNGIFSLFYGLPGAYWNDFLEKRISPVFIEELRNHDYDIRLFPSASLYNPPFDRNVFVAVADQCAATVGAKAWQRDNYLTNNFLSFLKTRNGKQGEKQNKTNPFFAFLFYDSLHSMIMPEEYDAPFKPTWMYPNYPALLMKSGKSPEYLNLYKNMARYLDNLLGELIGEMETQGLLENTVIVITGDHGQEFNDNGKRYWGHNGNFSDAQIRVPLIYYSHEKEPAVYTHWTAHYDVVPTLMQELFAVQNPPSDYSIGKSLFDTTRREFMPVDSYIALGIIDTLGTITNIYYGDGKYEITDSGLNELYDVEINNDLYKKVLEQIFSFYSLKNN